MNWPPNSYKVLLAIAASALFLLLFLSSSIVPSVADADKGAASAAEVSEKTVIASGLNRSGLNSSGLNSSGFKTTPILSTTNYALTPNVCPEGQYMDLTSNICRYLVKNFGFDAVQFDANFSRNEYTLGACTEAALQAIFDQMGTIGGKVILPACTIVVDVGLEIPSNVIMQGAGIGLTVFESGATFSHNMLKAEHQSNVIVRDLSVNGLSTSTNTGILVWYVDNALIERVDVHHNGKSGIIFRYAKQVTVRYVESHDHILWHGIDSKDCFPVDSSIPDSLECATLAGNVAPGVLWSEDYMVYSNRLYNNGRFGLNVHANNGEAAGNIVDNNIYGSKLPDAANVWIHHNEFTSNDFWGSWIYNTNDAPEKIAHNIVYFENTFAENQQHPIYIVEPAHDIYLLYNQYNNNVPNRLRIAPSTVYTCSGSVDVSMDVDGTIPTLASASECDLGQVAHIFGYDPNATPGMVDQLSPLGTVMSTLSAFEWTPQLTATHYKVALYDETNDTVLFFNDSSPYDASIVCTGNDPLIDVCSVQSSLTLLPGVAYRWLVQAWTNGVSGPWSMHP